MIGVVGCGFIFCRRSEGAGRKRADRATLRQYHRREDSEVIVARRTFMSTMITQREATIEDLYKIDGKADLEEAD